VRIVFIYRPERSGAYSIEGVFRSISCELRSRGVDAVDYVLANPRNAVADWARLRRLRADVYHVTGDVNYWAMLLPRSRTVLTIHDIGHYISGLRGLRKWLYGKFWVSLPIRLVGSVTAPSEATAGLINSNFGRTARRVRVVEMCHGLDAQPRAVKRLSGTPRVLQVGTARHKNVERLISALRGLRCRLILVGKIDSAIVSALVSANVEYENYFDLSKEELTELYATCDVATFLSTSEGFGMPIVEAQAMSCPIVTSDIRPMSDVAGAGACQANPFDVGEIRSAIKRILEDGAYRMGCVQAGLRNSEKFTPAAAVDRLIVVYQELYSGCFVSGQA